MNGTYTYMYGSLSRLPRETAPSRTVLTSLGQGG
eukprot:COSAG02_NODE_33247_length_503_cov_0.777228_1_plen_33_part_10